MPTKIAKLSAVAALAVGAAIGPMMAPAAHAATTKGNGCSTTTQNGWNIGVCSNTETFTAWGDGYINRHGTVPSGCVIELAAYITNDPGDELSATYPCSKSGHLDQLTFTGITAGDHIHTTVTVHGDSGNVFSHSYEN
jgi:hypothetical protein